MNLQEQLEEERRIINAATEGEWYINNSTHEATFVCCTIPSSPPDQCLIAEVPNMYHFGLFDAANPDAEFIAHARTALPQRNAQVQAVLELHRPSEYGCMSECRETNGDLNYPCPTVRAIEEATP